MTDIKRARVKQKSTYASFRRCLIADFEDLSKEKMKQLGTLMKNKGYRRFTNKETGMVEDGYPKPAQLKYAYGVLERIAMPKHVSEPSVREVYHRRVVWRALRNQEIGGRKYRRGQFIPTRNK